MRSKRRKIHPLGTLTAALLASFLCATTPAAQAGAGSPSLDECFYFGSAVASCAAAGPSTEGVDIELSPGGKQVYVLGQAPATIRIFDRGPGNQLTPRSGTSGCYTFDGSSGQCTFTPGLVYLNNDLDISPDGKSVYVAAGGNLVNLKRDTSTGTLTPQSCYGSEAPCVPLSPAGPVWSVVVSRDNADVYAQGFGILRAFQRDPSDGTLVPEPDGSPCFSETVVAGCTDSYGLKGHSYEMDFTPDGEYLYYPIQTPGGVGFFERAADGSLSRISGLEGGCITTDGSSTAAGECATLASGGSAMEAAAAATVSPSGSHVFVSGIHGTVVFSRNAETGKLTRTDCVVPNAITGCTTTMGSGGYGAAVSPDGTIAVVSSNDVDGVGVFDFDPTAGKLTPLATGGCFSGFGAPGCGEFPGGGDYGKAAWAPGGFSFYATAKNGLVNMAQDYGPVCQGQGATVPAGLSVAVPLTCSDPNGDPVTLQITRQPTAGLLAAIDTTAHTVRYQPFNGFLGADSFGYQGTANGATSAEANVTLNVSTAAAPESKGEETKGGGAKSGEASTTKPLKCKKGFRKMKVKGKPRCKKIKKHRGKRGH